MHSTPWQRAVQRSVTQHSTAQHSTSHHSTAQHSTAQRMVHSITQHSAKALQRNAAHCTTATARHSMTCAGCAFTHLVPSSEAQCCQPFHCSFLSQADLAGRLISAIAKAHASPEAVGQGLLIDGYIGRTLFVLLQTAAKHTKSGMNKAAVCLQSKTAETTALEGYR